MDMASSYTNGTSTISSYAKAVRSKSENSNEIVTSHRGSYCSTNGISRSVGTSSVGDSDGHSDDTTDWPELNYKQKVLYQPAPPPKENPWLINSNAATIIKNAMKFPPAADALNDSASSQKSSSSSSSGKGNSIKTSSSASSSSSYSSTSSSSAKSSESSSSEKNVGLTKTSGPVNKFSGSPIKSSHTHTKSGDSSNLPPRNIVRGRGRGVGRGRGSYRGKNNYYHHNQNYYPDDSLHSSATSAPREDYKDFPPDFAALAPVFPVSDYIMPYLGTFPPPTAFAPPLETNGILTLTTEDQSFPSFVTVDALTLDMVKNQIEYYFSEENLEKDFYLRRKMDSDGYLPVQLIASFRRLQLYDYGVVVAAIQSSEKLELTEDMTFVRTVNSPTKWPIHDSVVSLSISLFKAMKIDDPMLLPSPASSTVDTELDDGMMSTSSPIDSAIPSPSNGITLQSTMVSANGNGEMFNPNVAEFVPKSKVLY